MFRMDRKRYSSVHFVIVLLGLVQVLNGHLLPQALEDVHAYVQSELQRSQDGGSRMAVEGGPQGGPVFHATQTFIGTPITIQKELRLNGNGGFNGDLVSSQSQNFAQTIHPNPSDLPTGLMPPVPLEHPRPPQQQQQASSSNERPQVIAANVVGPSTFVQDAPREINRANRAPLPVQPQQQRQSALPQQNGDRGKTMEGWLPLDNEGSSLAKGVGVKLQVTEENKPQSQQQDSDPSYRGVGYSVRRPQGQQNQEDQQPDNGIEIVKTNTVKLQDIIVGRKTENLKSGSPARYPVYPRSQPNQLASSEASSPKVVIHAQNVIIRGNDQADSPLDITADNSTGSNNVKAIPAYSAVPQLNNFLRDQLRFAAMNQLLQSQVPFEHPLSGQQFPRPLSLREIAQAARNGQFPSDPRQDPLLPQPSLMSPSELQINIPHVVKMNPNQAAPDALPLASIGAHPKLALPGVGLGNLYQNILQQEAQGAGAGPGFDPREPLEYALLAALSGQKLKIPSVPKFKSRPHTQSDYGDSVTYSGSKDPKSKEKDPIQILSAAPAPGNPHSGSLRQMQDQLLKQLLLEELQEEVEDAKLRRPQQQQQLLLPVGLQVQKPSIFAPGPLKRPVPYGTNAHPFAHLAEELGPAAGQGGTQDHIIEETFEYDLPPGTSFEDFLRDDGQLMRGIKKRPRGPPRYISPYGGGGHSHAHAHPHTHPHSEDGDPNTMPLNKDTFMEFGKGLLSSALEFSRHHNPLTVLSRIRSLPPVKIDLYKVPMGVPDGLLEKLPEKWKTGGGGSPYGGGRGKRKHLPRKSNPKFY